MNRAIFGVVALLALSMQDVQAQKKNFTGQSLTAFFLPPVFCKKAKTCDIVVTVVPAASGKKCQAQFPIDIHIPNGYADMQLVWKIVPATGDNSRYMFDTSYGIESVADRDHQLEPPAPRSALEWAAVDKNTVPFSTIDYLPHVLGSPNSGTRFSPCEVIDPRIIND